jgi:mannosyltransferase OCH1-like enzyme
MFLKNIKQYKIPLLILILIIIILVFYKIVIIEKFTNNDSDLEHIPKIIHQTAPANKEKWHKAWFTCQESWKKQFPDFEYKLWTDEDNLKLIETDYPWFLETYNKYAKNINRIDIIRYFILDKYGGIYADMDYICIKNFYNILPQNKVSIPESPYKHNEHIQNALMCSPKKHSFWMKVINTSKSRMDNNDKIDDILYITGPKLISDVYDENKDDVNILPINTFNPDKNSENFKDDTKLYTKHFCTSVWY